MNLILFIASLSILVILFCFANNVSKLTTVTSTVDLPDKIAVIMHVGDINVFKEILTEYPNFFNNNEIDLYFSCNNTEVFQTLQNLFPESKVFKYENKGMDIGPFLLILKYLIQKNANYKYYIKLHTKTVKKWRDGLIYPLYNKLNYFLNDKVPSSTIELYGSENMTLNRQFELNYIPILNIIGRNYKKYESKFLKYCSETTNNHYACEPSPSFVGGTIFVFNDKYFNILKQIKNIDYEYSILEPGYIINDEPRNTHAWEYLFGYIVYLNNEKIKTI